MFLTIDAVCKTFQGQRILDKVSFAVAEGELVSIIGPSGAGKTTLLKIIAGLDVPDTGRILSQADLLLNPAILVFQDYVLFPTMTIFDNIVFGLKARKMAKSVAREKVMAMLAYFGLSDKAVQFPSQLSSGQQQRVALARAMVVGPSILLLDEPFANLDRNLKSDTAEFIRTFQKEYKITTISVTHDLQEAFMMSDKIGILLDGELCQYDDASVVYHEPASARVAAFLGHVNTISSRYFPQLSIAQPIVGKGNAVSVRAESLVLEKDPHGAGVIEDILFAGPHSVCRIRIDDLLLTAYSFGSNLNINDRVRVGVKKIIQLKGDPLCDG
ncbi:MAG: ABC transporter ATP-binding protein [Pseudomonadota bacterium]